MNKIIVNGFQLTNKEAVVLQYLCRELEPWRVSEPDYSCVGGADVTSRFKWKPKITSGVVSSLVQKGLCNVVDDFEDTIFISWDNIGDFHKLEDIVLDGVVADDIIVEESKIDRTKPYSKNGLHGTNIEVEGFNKGDVVHFLLNGKKVTGIFKHVHVNKHSPNGYAVITYKGKIYERVLSKITNKKQK